MYLREEILLHRWRNCLGWGSEKKVSWILICCVSFGFHFPLILQSNKVRNRSMYFQLFLLQVFFLCFVFFFFFPSLYKNCLWNLSITSLKCASQWVFCQFDVKCCSFVWKLTLSYRSLWTNVSKKCSGTSYNAPEMSLKCNFEYKFK